LRRELVEAALTLDRLGLNQGQAGNLSLRQDSSSMLITPSGIRPGKLQSSDLVSMDFTGERQGGQRQPSSEWQMHARIYQARTDLQALVHTHSPYATALACMERGIPPFHYMVAQAGSDHIPCAPYALFGSTELADHCATTLGTELRACLMARHGMLCGGKSLEGAINLALSVEHLAKIYCCALHIGDPGELSQAQMQQVLEQMTGYGQPAQRD